MMKILEGLEQGSAQWLAVRAQHYCASDAPAAMGVSKYKTRDALLREKKTGFAPEHDERTQKLFAAGHASEDAARPIAEAIAFTELRPAVGVREVEGMPLLASFDGFDGEVVWENKLRSNGIVQQVESGDLEPNYWAQIEHQLLVSGTQRALFTASDGTEAGTVHCWYVSQPSRRQAVLSAWHQFAADLAAYVPTAPAPIVVAQAVESLPAVSVRMDGQLVVESNLPAFGAALQAFVAKIPAKPTTDQEFADTEAACKALKKAEDTLEAAEANAMAGIANVEAMRRMVADFRDLARTTRLASEKMVKARKEQIREEEVRRGREAYAAHLFTLNTRLGGNYMPLGLPDFAGAIKGLKTIDSVRNAIDTEVARAKIETSALADKIEANLKLLTVSSTAEHRALFPDAATLVLKAPDDLAAVIAHRRTVEQQRQDAERERIRAEETARIEREHAATILVMEGVDAINARHTPPDAQGAPVTPAMLAGAALALRGATQPDTPPTLTVGKINQRLGFVLTGAFIVQTLRIAPAALSNQNTPLWHESALPHICAGLAEHVLTIGGAA